MEIRLGESIRRLRKESGFTQEQLAEALGVTTGAVHKWESGKATPELEMLVNIAEFFETSVDALLNYGWEKMSMGQAVEKLRGFLAQRELADGIRYAEKALKKYPNSFLITFTCAEIYYMATADKSQYALRTVELYKNSLALFSQNKNPNISQVTIQNRIAECYYFMNRTEEAVELLKNNNVEGLNNSMIGYLLSKEGSKEVDALRYLSYALYGGQATIFRTCVGYVNAYTVLGEYRQAEELILWLLEMSKGLRETEVISYLDKADVWLYAMLAAVALQQNDNQSASDWLRNARTAALRFDTAPEHKACVGLKFYHGDENVMSYDSMGETAIASIENFIMKEDLGRDLLPVWEKICTEE